MTRFKALSAGPKLLLVASPLLFVSLFFTWQKLEIDFGPAGTGERLLDGWDFWGLLIGLVTLSLTALAIVAYFTDVELSENVPWDRLVLAGGITTLVLTVVKVLRDADSTWMSYVAIGLAGLVALGAYEIWAEGAQRRSLLGRGRGRGISSAA